MKKDITNKTLVFLVSFSMIMTVTATLIFLQKTENLKQNVPESITGLQVFSSNATDTAKARINITAQISINWTGYYLDWGTGEAAIDPCELNTRQGIPTPENCTGFNNLTTPLILENTGNKKMTLNMSVDMDAAGLINGTNPKFQWWWEENETGSCTSAIGAGSGYGLQQNDTWYDVTTTPQLICPYFQSAEASDALNMHVRLILPMDAMTGDRNATFTATATVAKN
jgi:hypothetical protein